MKKNFLLAMAVGLLCLMVGSQAFAGLINLNTWSQAGILTNGTWTVSSDGTSVTQAINGNPTYFVSDTDYINTSFEGSFKVNTTSDDDFIGFVFGLNSLSDYYLFDWKQSQQATGNGTAYEGYTLSKISGSDVNFWGHAGNDITVLDTSYSSTSGWNDNTAYTFLLDYTATSLSIKIDGTEIFSETGSFSSGKFGFYNYSQSNVFYQGFEEEQLPDPTAPVPEPSSILLLGAGLFGIAGAARRKLRQS